MMPIHGPRCHSCGVGRMASAKERRLPTVLVVIGFLVLVPSILGFLFFGLGTAAAFLPGNEAREAGHRETLKLEAVETLVELGIPRRSAAEILENSEEPLPAETSRAAAAAVAAARHEYQVALAKRTVMTGMGFVAAFVCLFGVLIGWLLTRRKDVLCCGHCRATIAGL